MVKILQQFPFFYIIVKAFVYADEGILVWVRGGELLLEEEKILHCIELQFCSEMLKA